MADAVEAGIVEPEAMTLATVGPDGAPSARMVLLKGVDARGFAFYTNYRSAKARELHGNPAAALVFRWTPLQRQVRVTGSVREVATDESDAYFAGRPRESQLGAWASEQSEVISGRPALEDALAGVTARFAGRDVPRPPHWGGFRLRPSAIELWQAGPARLHDRIRYRRSSTDGWIMERLAP
jgi:pyridoxamine 5'-phosphate oxidase